MEYTLDQLAQMIDHTNLHADADHAAMEKLCKEAKDYHFKMVAINSAQCEYCSKLLKGTDIHVGSSVSFPLGQTSIAAKCFEAENAIQTGVDEIDYVINLTEVKEGNYEYVKKEMEAIVSICKAHNVISKVIFETCYLNSEQIVKLAGIAAEVKPDFIKTSTGFGTGGATCENVKLMKDTVGKHVKVKAAGGIRDAETFIEMIRNGAERIGTSAGVKIIEELKAMMINGKISI